EMPGAVLLPGVRLQERVLLPCPRLHLLPPRAEHVPARVDQPHRVPDRLLVHRVGGHTRILADPPASDRSETAASRPGSPTRVLTRSGTGETDGLTRRRYSALSLKTRSGRFGA